MKSQTYIQVDKMLKMNKKYPMKKGNVECETINNQQDLQGSLLVKFIVKICLFHPIISALSLR